MASSARRRGLAPSALADAGEQLAATQQLVSEETPSAATIREIPIEDVSPHPGNPIGRLDVDDEFVASIRDHGILQAGTVIPRAVYERSGGAVADLSNPVASHVIVFGARRWAGARAAGLSTYPATVHDREITDRDIRIRRVLENVHRQDLAEIDEATEYQLLLDDLGSQRKVADLVRKSQAHISRRLKLLDLPENFQQALRARAITVEIAGELGRLPAPEAEATLAELLALPRDLEADQRVTARRQIIDRARQNVDRVQRVTDACARAAAASIPLLDDPTTRFGDDAPGHRVENRQLLEAARATGNLLAHVTGNGDTHYYLADLPAAAAPAAPADTAGITPEPVAGPAAANPVGPTDTASITTPAPGRDRDFEEPSIRPAALGDTAGITAQGQARPPSPRRDGDDVERRAASQERVAACRRLVGKAPTREQLVNRLVTRIIDGEQHSHAAAAALACQWLCANGVGPTDLDGHEYLKHVSTGDDHKLRTHFAYALDLALDEARTARSRTWDARDAAHVRRLEQDASYEPTSWELTQLLAATPPAEALAD